MLVISLGIVCMVASLATGISLVGTEMVHQCLSKNASD
ncbi:MAG: hypothetical protein H6R25_827 [Proteobacteria bacterium]|nr:hypothetical protein [Pseudomonadota bacterium]